MLRHCTAAPPAPFLGAESVIKLLILLKRFS
nr:MAG TPA: hypothetical protein [Caudoviricetes sp.]